MVCKRCGRREITMSGEYLTRLREVQALEEARVATLKEEARLAQIADYQATLVENWGTYEEKLTAMRAEQAKEQYEVVWKYGYAAVDLLRQIHARELDDFIQAEAERKSTLQEGLRQEMEIGRLTMQGRDAEAGALRLLAEQAERVQNALAAGLSGAEYQAVLDYNRDQMAKYWLDAINEIKRAMGEVVDTLEDNLERIRGKMVDFTNGQLEGANAALQLAQESAEAYKQAGQAIRATLTALGSGDLSPLSPERKYLEAQARWSDVYRRGMTGDASALGEASGLAQTVLEAARAFLPDQSVYSDFFGTLTSQLASLGVTSDTMGYAADYQVQLLERQVALLESLNSELGQDNPDTVLLQQTVAALGIVGELLAGTRDVAVRLDDTAAPLREAVNSQTGQVVMVHLLTSDYWEGGSRTMRASDAIESGAYSADRFIEFFSSRYGAGSGYVDWWTALTQWIDNDATTALRHSDLNADISGAYDRAGDLYAQWQALKEQYGFAVGGAITVGTPGVDNSMVLAQPGERVLTVAQNHAFESLAFNLPSLLGSDDDEDYSELIAAVLDVGGEVRQLRGQLGRDMFLLIKHAGKIAKFFSDYETPGLPVQIVS